MKKNYSFYSILTAIPVALLILVGFSSGQPGSFSGSPGDGGSTCTTCHAPTGSFTGTPVLSNVPAAYAANQTYTLNLAINGSNASKFGFNITAENAAGTKIGRWSVGATTRLRTDNAGLTHTTAGSNNNNWNLDWIAPSSDQGAVTFYYATIQANGNGANSGDQMLSGQSTAILTNPDEKMSSFRLYPTQVGTDLYIALSYAPTAQLEIFNMNGQQVWIQELGALEQIDVSSLTSGMYISRVSVDGQVSVRKFFKK